MRLAALGFCLALPACGQSSTPAHWRYAPAEPALLAGVDGRQVSQSRLSPLASGALQGTANLDFVEEMASLLVAVEPGGGQQNRFLAVATGRFNLTKLRMMAAAEGARTGRYRGVEFFSADGAEIAVIDRRTVLAGDTKSVRAAVDRGVAATPRESPMWRRAAELSASYAVWVVASPLDALVSKQAGAPPAFSGLRALDGGLALNRGLELAFDLTASSEESAEAVEGVLRAAASPAWRELTVRREGAKVRLTAAVELAQVETGLKAMLASGPPQRASLMDWVISGAQPAPAAVPAAVRPKVTAPSRPKRVIRIIGLEEGTREIPFPAPLR
jgi:hypothetical protein